MNRSLKIRAVISLLALATSAPKVSAQEKDACSFVAAADAEAVLGEPVMPPQKESHNSSTLQASTCRFLPSQSQGKYLSVILYQAPSYGNTGITPMLDYIKKMNFKNVLQVSGVGTDAAWGSLSVAGKLICELYARKDKSAWIAIMITGLPDDADTLGGVKTLANQVLSKL